MFTLVLIGFFGGLITGISPCILPVLPVIFFSGAQTARTDGPAQAQPDGGGVITAVKPARTLSETLRPYWVIAGLVLSFSLVTLVGTALLSLLHLPQDAIRWAGLIALTAIGLGLIFPRFEQILEKPFSRIPQLQVGQGKSGFGLGLALGVLYVPCAGPVLAAIVVAGATGTIGLEHRRVDVVIRDRRRPAAVVLRAGRPAGRRAGRHFPPPSASDPGDRRHRDARVRARVGVQCARQTAASHPRLHQRAAEQGRGVGRDPGEAQPRRPGQRPEQGAVELHQRRTRSSKAAAPHRISRASPVGSTPRAAHRST